MSLTRIIETVSDMESRLQRAGLSDAAVRRRLAIRLAQLELSEDNCVSLVTARPFTVEWLP